MRHLLEVPPSFRAPTLPTHKYKLAAKLQPRSPPPCGGRAPSRPPETEPRQFRGPLPPSQPGGGLTAGEQSHGHGDDRDDNGNPQEPQQPLQDGLQGEVPSGGSRTGPTTCATRSEQGVPGAPLSRTHLHGAMEQRCEAAGGAAAAVLGSGGEARGGEVSKGPASGPCEAAAARWTGLGATLGAWGRGRCRLQEASSGRRRGLSEITFFLLAPQLRGVSQSCGFAFGSNAVSGVTKLYVGEEGPLTLKGFL